MIKWFMATSAFVFVLTGCSTNRTSIRNGTSITALITQEQAKQIVLHQHKHNPNGHVIIVSVSHAIGEYKVSWKVDSKILDYGTDYVSDTTGKIIHGTETVQ